MPDAGSLLEGCHFSRRAPDGSRWLLDDISLSLDPGERLTVVGPSGAGKTLLLRALAMLDPSDVGHVLWRGEAVRQDAVPEFRRQVMYLHQRSALFEDTVEGALRQPFGLKVYRGRQFDRDATLERLAALGRDASFLEKRVRDLSGGEAQLVALLRAVQLKPAVLLLDEPTAALDESTAAAVETLVNRWFDEPNQPRALIWVTHDGIQAERVARRAIRMEAGRIVA